MNFHVKPDTRINNLPLAEPGGLTLRQHSYNGTCVTYSAAVRSVMVRVKPSTFLDRFSSFLMDDDELQAHSFLLEIQRVLTYIPDGCQLHDYLFPLRFRHLYLARCKFSHMYM